MYPVFLATMVLSVGINEENLISYYLDLDNIQIKHVILLHFQKLFFIQFKFSMGDLKLDNPLQYRHEAYPYHPHLLSPQFKQVIHPSINTIALVLHLLHKTAFSGNACPSDSPCAASNSLRFSSRNCLV